jgi:hypothetical protein
VLRKEKSQRRLAEQARLSKMTSRVKKKKKTPLQLIHHNHGNANESNKLVPKRNANNGMAEGQN